MTTGTICRALDILAFACALAAYEFGLRKRGLSLIGLVGELWRRFIYAINTLLYGVPEIRTWCESDGDPPMLRGMRLYRVGVVIDLPRSTVSFNHFEDRRNPLQRAWFRVRYWLGMVNRQEWPWKYELAESSE